VAHVCLRHCSASRVVVPRQHVLALPCFQFVYYSACVCRYCTGSSLVLLPAALAGLLCRLSLSSLPFHCTSRCLISSSGLQVVLVMQRGNLATQVLQQLAVQVVPHWPLVVLDILNVVSAAAQGGHANTRCTVRALVRRTCRHNCKCCVLSGLVWPCNTGLCLRDALE
jgi:hypothetical protein